MNVVGLDNETGPLCHHTDFEDCKAGHTLHKPITQVTCLKPYCTITVSSLVQVPPTHYAIFFSQMTGRN